MKLVIQIFLVVTMLVLFEQSFSQNPFIENKRWVLYKIDKLPAKTTQYVEEYHYLEFRDGRVSFAIDCNSCSAPYEFLSKDTVHIKGPVMCTRRGCLDTDAIRITYNGQYKIQQKGMYLIIRTEYGDHFYK